MICSVVKKETLRAVESGGRVLTFDASDHWRKRITPVHKAIMILSGGRCLIHSVKRIERTDDAFTVHLGGGWDPPRQQGLFDE